MSVVSLKFFFCFLHEPYSGHADANDERRLLLADAGSEYKLYSLDPPMRCIRNFPTPTSSVHFPRQVSFAENERVVVGGSKEGVVYVFDTKTGAPLDLLHHSDCKVLAIAVR
jgi:WD40 repeat protein